MVSATETDRDFYAVRPELVLRASDLFAVSSSMLERGAKRLHSRAVAIRAGKEAGQWGRHQRPVIDQFCDYTQTSGSRFVLPWQELVEHNSRYDGKEGISSRTGNKPLSTVMRLVVDVDAFKRARTVSGLSIESLSHQSQLPPVLLTAIESGAWPDIAQNTAATLAECLDFPESELFTAMDADDRDPVAADDAPLAQESWRPVDKPGASAASTTRSLAIVVAVVLAAAVAVYLAWPDNEQPRQTTCRRQRLSIPCGERQ